MISLDLMKSSEGKKAGDRSKNISRNWGLSYKRNDDAIKNSDSRTLSPLYLFLAIGFKK